MTKRAVVVGVNDYSGIDSSGKSNLSSCVADADSTYREAEHPSYLSITTAELVLAAEQGYDRRHSRIDSNNDQVTRDKVEGKRPLGQRLVRTHFLAKLSPIDIETTKHQLREEAKWRK